MVKAIIFDCFGVLTSDLWKEFVLGLAEDHQEPVRALNRAHGRGDITLHEFANAVFDLTGQQPHVVEAVISADTTKNQALMGYIDQLSKDYKIGVLSNVGSNWIRERFLGPEEQAMFSDFVLSYEVHLAKPDPAIFSLAAERLKLEPEVCVFVDDGQGNCDAAASVGMQTVCYTSFEQCKTDIDRLLANTNN